jgi:hypothetical protein
MISDGIRWLTTIALPGLQNVGGWPMAKPTGVSEFIPFLMEEGKKGENVPFFRKNG